MYLKFFFPFLPPPVSLPPSCSVRIIQTWASGIWPALSVIRFQQLWGVICHSSLGLTSILGNVELSVPGNGKWHVCEAAGLVELESRDCSAPLLLHNQLRPWQGSAKLG